MAANQKDEWVDIPLEATPSDPKDVWVDVPTSANAGEGRVNAAQVGASLAQSAGRGAVSAPKSPGESILNLLSKPLPQSSRDALSVLGAYGVGLGHGFIPGGVRIKNPKYHASFGEGAASRLSSLNDPEFTPENMAAVNQTEDKLVAEHPVASTIGNILGMIASPLNEAVRAVQGVGKVAAAGAGSPAIRALLTKAAEYLPLAGQGASYGLAEEGATPQSVAASAAAFPALHGAGKIPVVKHLLPPAMGAAMGAELAGEDNRATDAVLGGTTATAATAIPALLSAIAKRQSPAVMKQPLDFLEAEYEKMGAKIPEDLRSGTRSIPGYQSERVRGIRNQVDDIEARELLKENTLQDFEKTEYYQQALRDLEERLNSTKSRAFESERPAQIEDLNRRLLDNQRQALRMPEKPAEVEELRRQLLDQRGQLDQVKAKKYITQQFTRSITDQLGEVGDKTLAELTGEEMGKVTSVVGLLDQARGQKGDAVKNFNKFIEQESQVNPKLQNMPIRELIYAKARKTPYTSLLQMLNSFADLPDKSQVPSDVTRTISSNIDLRDKVYKNELDKWFRTSSPENQQKLYRLFDSLGGKEVTGKYADERLLGQDELAALLKDNPEVGLTPKKVNIRVDKTPREPAGTAQKKQLQDEKTQEVLGLRSDIRSTQDEIRQILERAREDKALRRNSLADERLTIKDEKRQLADSLRQEKQGFTQSKRGEIQQLKQEQKQVQGQYKNELAEGQRAAKQSFEQSKEQELAPLLKQLSDIAEGRKFYKSESGESGGLSIPKLSKYQEALSLLNSVLSKEGKVKRYVGKEPQLRADYLKAQLKERGILEPSMVESAAKHGSDFIKAAKVLTPENEQGAARALALEILNEIKKDSRQQRR